MNNKRGRPKSFLTKTDRLEVRLSKEQVYWLNYLMNILHILQKDKKLIELTTKLLMQELKFKF